MKALQKLRALSSSPPSTKPISLLFSTTTSTTLSPSPSPSSPDDLKTETETPNTLTQQDLTEINLLIPRLCASNHLREAIRLFDAAALVSNPGGDLRALSLPVLVDRLSAEPDLALSMSLLNRLKHRPNPNPNLLSVAKMLVSAYSKKGRAKEMAKVFDWMRRPDSLCPPDSGVYALVAGGFCGNSMVLEAVRVVRAMVGAGFVPGADLRARVYRALLREARVGEAQEFNGAFGGGVGNGDEDFEKVSEVLDRIIAHWVE